MPDVSEREILATGAGLVGLWILARRRGDRDTDGDDDSSEPTDPAEVGSSFSWHQTFTETDWLYDAADNGSLNVEVVTSLDPDSSDGLLAAVERGGDEPTIVVFEVGGVIELDPSQRFHIRNDNTYIAGETAPWPGISIIRGRCRIYADSVILSHIGVFPGDETDGAQSAIVPDGDDIVADHCTGMWGTDEVLSASNRVDRNSWINCICAEGLFDSIHPDGPHSRGMFYNDPSDECVGLGNLLAHNNRRNPMTRADLVWCNNWIYNHGRHCFNLDNPKDPLVTSISNVYEMGHDSIAHDGRYLYQYGGTLYTEDTDSLPRGRPVSDGDHELVDSPPIWPPGLNREDLVSFEDTPHRVRRDVGARPADRAPVEDDFIRNRLRDTSAGIIDSQSQVGGYPDYAQTDRALSIPTDSTELLPWLAGFRAEIMPQPSANATDDGRKIRFR